VRTLKVGSIEIPARACLDLDQTYEPIGGESILRTISGAGIKQVTWSKTRTTISGGGWIPNGLASINYAAQQTIACLVPRGVTCDGSRQATLPAARRADTGYTPWAIAMMDDGSAVSTPVSIATNTATATAVAGAVGYQVLYYPLLTCWVARPTESGTVGEASYRWEMVAEET
jgi:hypothetical protein